MLDEAWTLSPSVALRPEPFGALAYHFGNRKLTFLKRPELVAVVRASASNPTSAARSRTQAFPSASTRPTSRRSAASPPTDMIRPRTAEAEKVTP